MRVRQANGDLRSVTTDGTCLDFLTPAACASLMGASEASWLGGRGDLFVGRVWFSAFLGGLGGRLLVLLLLLRLGLLLLLLLGGLALTLVHVECGVERNVRVWREDVCHR